MYEFLLGLISKENISSIGLALDLVGVLCIAYSFKNIRREKHTAARLVGDENYQKKQDKEHTCLIKLDRVGTLLLVMGFSLQIVSNYM